MSVKAAIDATAIFTTVASVLQWAPPIAAVFSIIWLGMQIIMNWDKFKATLKNMFTRS